VQVLATVPLAGHRICLPTGTDHAAALAQLTALLGQAAGPETAGLFAEPRSGPSKIEYIAPDGRVARYDELDAEGRAALRAEIGRLVSLLRRAAESAAQRDPQRCGNWPDLVAGAIEIPTFELVYAYEGRPVLAGWGLGPAAAPMGLGLIRVLDDGQPAAPRFVFPIWAAALSILALLALGAMAAVSASTLVALFDPAEAVCRVSTADQRAFLELESERQREQELRRSLGSIQQARGEKRAACPIPAVPSPSISETPPQPPSIATAPPPPKPQPQARPDDRLKIPERRTSSMDFVKGCWRTDPFRHRAAVIPGVSTYCFDADGRGTLTFERRELGHRCRLAARAQWAGNELHLDDTDGVCNDGTTWHADHLICRPDQSGIAHCTGTAVGFDPQTIDRWTVTLHRQ
jgi:hypothetical protein